MSYVAIRTQISAGDVPRSRVAIISVGDEGRWQLPKGIVEKEESTEAAAVREVREETGLETEVLELIDKVEYWYYSSDRK